MPNEPATAAPARGIQFPDGDNGFDPTRIGRFTHTFHDHPLMEISALRELGLRLEKADKGQVKYQTTGAKPSDKLAVHVKSDRGFGVQEAFERITEPRSWIALYEVQSDPEYRGFIADVLDSVRDIVDPLDPGMFDRDGFIFISAPPAATPFHIDRENNFFLQCKGRKRMAVWSREDRSVIEGERIIEKLGTGGCGPHGFQESFWDRAVVNDELRPGDGVYMPFASPHTTSTEFAAESEHPYSVSIGVVYYTKATQRAAHASAFNRIAGKFGIPGAPPLKATVGNRIRAGLGQGVIQAKRVLKGFKPPAGF